MLYHSAKPAWHHIHLGLFYLAFGIYLFLFWMAALMRSSEAPMWTGLTILIFGAIYYAAAMLLVGCVCLVQYFRKHRLVELLWEWIVFPIIANVLYLLILPYMFGSSSVRIGDIVLYTAILLPPLAAIWQIALAKRTA